MNRGILLCIRSRWHHQAAKALVGLATVGLICGAGLAQATAASATPLPPSTSSCSYSNATTPANPSAVLGVTPGSTVSISCAAGSLPASSLMVVVEASGLAGIISPSSSQISEIDLGDLGVANSGADGSLSTIFTLPTAFSASDSNAACPPTQDQINIGLTCDLVLISVFAGLQPVNEAMITYAGQGTPNAPTLHATFKVHKGVKTITASDATGACPTPPTATSHCWWGAPVTGSPNSTAFSGIPAPEAKVSKLITSGTLAVSPAVYCESGATAPACANVPDGTLIPPALSGSVVTMRGLLPLLIDEPNATPYTGNGTLPSLFLGTRNVAANETGALIRING
jgi:hypothetical protein